LAQARRAQAVLVSASPEPVSTCKMSQCQSQLAGLLTMVPPTFSQYCINDFLTPDSVKDFLTKRKNYRRTPNSKSGSTANPSLQAPLSGKWRGACKECRTQPWVDGQQAVYYLSFKPCGSVEGTGNGPEGDFVVKGVYNMAKGTVAWRQKSSQASENDSKLSSEFVGELILAHGPSQRGSIVGSFLTADGDYYTVDLQDPGIQPHNARLPEPLPTLLTGAGGCTPKGATTPTHFHSKI